MKRLALIDADSICYIVAWHHKDSEEFLVTEACDSIVREILKRTEATHYLGCFSSTENFRKDVYLYAEYKGNRPDKPDWVRQWETIIKSHLITEWGFVTSQGCEADDILSGFPYVLEDDSYEIVYCSPDKDLKQLEGLHFDYKKMDNPIETVSHHKGLRNYFVQLLSGDSTDNVKGLFGVGEDKATKLLADTEDEVDAYQLVVNEYHKRYGDYYGPIILKQTELVIQLLTPLHPMWDTFKDTMNYRVMPVPDTDLDIPEL
jgi:5'-3' exonuclease